MGATFHLDSEKFSLLDEESTWDNYFSFGFKSENVVAGCYFMANPDTAELGDCYPMIGSRKVEDTKRKFLSIQKKVGMGKPALSYRELKTLLNQP